MGMWLVGFWLWLLGLLLGCFEVQAGRKEKRVWNRLGRFGKASGMSRNRGGSTAAGARGCESKWFFPLRFSLPFRLQKTRMYFSWRPSLRLNKVTALAFLCNLG